MRRRLIKFEDGLVSELAIRRHPGVKGWPAAACQRGRDDIPLPWLRCPKRNHVATLILPGWGLLFLLTSFPLLSRHMPWHGKADPSSGLSARFREIGVVAAADFWRSPRQLLNWNEMTGNPGRSWRACCPRQEGRRPSCAACRRSGVTSGTRRSPERPAQGRQRRLHLLLSVVMGDADADHPCRLVDSKVPDHLQGVVVARPHEHPLSREALGHLCGR